MSDELLKQLETGHDKECAMSYGMHEHCCDCSYVVRQEAAVRIRELEARVRELEEAYTAKMKETVYVAAERDALRALAFAPWAKHDPSCLQSPEYCLLCRIRATLKESP